MAAIVLTSSSPPRAFARSPTPVESSSPLPSPSALFRDGGCKKFKSADKVRDSFSGGFTSARSLLATKVGAENIPLRSSPGKDKFKPAASSPSLANNATPPRLRFIPKGKSSQHEDNAPMSGGLMRKAQISAPKPNVQEQNNIFDLPEDEHDEGAINTDLPGAKRDESPLPLEKAIPRRMDWTPTRSSPTISTVTPDSEIQRPNFSESLQTFTFTDAKADIALQKVATKVDVNGEAMKRRRIDLVATNPSHGEPLLPQLQADQIKDSGKGGSRKRKKSPAKKPLTITGLATSHYGEEHRTGRKLAPMMEYLASTQANAGREPDSVVEMPANKASKALAKKPRTTKKAVQKSRLQSPNSVMKTVESQEFLFGSASQLAREESPTLLRDTLEAIKQSEVCLSSDPISPQRTQPFSIESTSPQARQGTVRFVRKRNLWNAAGRDEDNALLHVETINLVESPAVREALAGKNVLVQPGGPMAPSIGSVQQGSTSFQMQQTPLVNRGGTLLDIDEMVTPGLRIGGALGSLPQIRSFHTSTSLQQPRKETPPLDDIAPPPANSPKANVTKIKTAPPKPSYAGFATHDLQKQISAYGFKAVKSRDKMIELLNQCWEDKHGPSPDHDTNEVPAETLTHGDFLSKVHDIAARPVPKVKKPRKRKSEDAGPKTPKEPKKRKKSSPKPKTPAEKATKGKSSRKPKETTTKKALSEEFVMDVDDIDDPSAETNVPSKPPEDVPGPAVKKKKATPKKKEKAKEKAKKPATPPPTLPLISVSSPPAFGAVEAKTPAGSQGPTAAGRSESSRLQVVDKDNSLADPDATLTPSQTPPLPDINTQIAAAIEFENKLYSVPSAASTSTAAASRNHVTNPTWREKILMYDPIVLEDLTRWLNTEGFKAIDEDREVNPIEVRGWCEQNGVCCLWKGGWRGRRKGGDGEG
ncbi:5'-flap endonuclease [Exophiala xenobiotica]|nr:5'-flap endonuclease [Exophiala xenobiotica]KAK5405322.1 5'-flap endonuclease [Exophiala xenobiotica]